MSSRIVTNASEGLVTSDGFNLVWELSDVEPEPEPEPVTRGTDTYVQPYRIPFRLPRPEEEEPPLPPRAPELLPDPDEVLDPEPDLDAIWAKFNEDLQAAIKAEEDARKRALRRLREDEMFVLELL